ncbi:hypothetical protein GCM10009646_85920 [Streptomyces aureus]
MLMALWSRKRDIRAGGYGEEKAAPTTLTNGVLSPPRMPEPAVKCWGTVPAGCRVARRVLPGRGLPGADHSGSVDREWSDAEKQYVVLFLLARGGPLRSSTTHRLAR